MKKNINTPEYYDNQFKDKIVDFDNTLRQDMYLELLGNARTIVELGCGVSAFCPMAARKGREVCGVDFAPQTIKRLQKEFPDVNWVVADVRKTPFYHEVFDAVVSGEVIEHLENPHELLKEMYRICKIGGFIIISTPNLEFDDPEHIREYTEKEVQEMLSGYGETTTKIIFSEKFPGRKYIFAKCIKK